MSVLEPVNARLLSLTLSLVLLVLAGCFHEPPDPDPIARRLVQDGLVPSSDLPAVPGATGGWAGGLAAALREGPYQLHAEDDGSLRFRNPARALTAHLQVDGSVSFAAIEQAETVLTLGSDRRSGS